MILDCSQRITVDGAIVFPDWNFSSNADQGPSPTGPVHKEIVVLRGTNIGSTFRAGGIIDDPEP
jgi:hypothetical protein